MKLWISPSDVSRTAEGVLYVWMNDCIVLLITSLPLVRLLENN